MRRSQLIGAGLVAAVAIFALGRAGTRDKTPVEAVVVVVDEGPGAIALYAIDLAGPTSSPRRLADVSKDRHGTTWILIDSQLGLWLLNDGRLSFIDFRKETRRELSKRKSLQAVASREDGRVWAVNDAGNLVIVDRYGKVEVVRDSAGGAELFGSTGSGDLAVLVGTDGVTTVDSDGHRESVGEPSSNGGDLIAATPDYLVWGRSCVPAGCSDIDVRDIRSGAERSFDLGADRSIVDPGAVVQVDEALAVPIVRGARIVWMRLDQQGGSNVVSSAPPDCAVDTAATRPIVATASEATFVLGVGSTVCAAPVERVIRFRSLATIRGRVLASRIVDASRLVE